MNNYEKLQKLLYIREVLNQDFKSLVRDSENLETAYRKVKDALKTKETKKQACSSCGTGISDKVANYSLREYDKTLCMKCQENLG